jgi:hypothetical protein
VLTVAHNPLPFPTGVRVVDPPFQPFREDPKRIRHAQTGCACVISHDRWFLDRIATHILAFEGNSEVVWFEGNHDTYKEVLHKRKGIDADQPHRMAYKKLVRA